MSELTNALITYDDVIAKTNIDVLRKIAKIHDFAIFDKGNYNLNIWGIDVILLIPNILMIFF